MFLQLVRRVRNSLRARGDVALGYVGAALQAPRFAFERLQPLDRAAHLVDKALFSNGLKSIAGE